MTGHSKKYPPSGAWSGADGCASWDSSPGRSAASDEGTKRHALIEAWLRHRINPSPIKGEWTWPTTVQCVFEDTPEVVPVTSDDVRAVQELIPYLEKHPAVINYGQPGHMVWVEEHVDFGLPMGRGGEDLTGTADIIFLTPTTLEVVDNKFGRKPRYPDDPQMWKYGIGAGGIIYGPEWASHAAQVRTLKLTILQPGHPAGPVQSKEWSIDFLIQKIAEVKKWVKARDEGYGIVYNPTDRACRYCAKRTNCPGRMRAAADMLPPVETVTAAAGPAPLAPADQIKSLSEVHAGRDVKEISDDEIASLLEVSGQMKAFLSDMEAEAKRRLNEGRATGGLLSDWKMIPGKRARKAKVSEKELIHIFRETWKVPKEDLRNEDGSLKKEGCFDLKLKSLAKLEKLVVTQLSPARQKKFAELWEMAPGAPVLAPMTDPAPGINPHVGLLDGADGELPNPNNARVNGQSSEPMAEEPKPDWY